MSDHRLQRIGPLLAKSSRLSYTIDANDSLVVTLPGVLVPRNKPAIKGPGGILLDFDFQSFAPTGSAMATVVLTNGVATY